MQGCHSLQSLGQEEGLPKPGMDLTGQEGQLGLESVDTGTVFDQGDGTGAANYWVPGIQLPWGLISSILEGLGMTALVLLSRLTYCWLAWLVRIRGRMWGTGWGCVGERMTSTLIPWLRGVHSTFPSEVHFQRHNNHFHKGAFLEYSPPTPKLFSWMLRATPHLRCSFTRFFGTCNIVTLNLCSGSSFSLVNMLLVTSLKRELS